MNEPTRSDAWLPAGETPCLWMLAGVLTCWLCDRELQCDRCPLDAALRHDAEQARRSPRRLRERPRLPQGPSTREPCPERSLRDLLETPLPPLDPEALYTRHHTWVRPLEGGRVRIGVDPFAARLVGCVRCVVLPVPRTPVRAGHACAWLDQAGGTLTVLAPVSGQVEAGNMSLAQRHDFQLHEPLGEDWLLEVRPTRFRTESKALLDTTAFADLVQRDLEAWRAALRRALDAGPPPSVGETLTDGGVAVRPPAQLLGRGGQHRLAKRFLQPRGWGGQRRARP